MGPFEYPNYAEMAATGQAPPAVTSFASSQNNGTGSSTLRSTGMSPTQLQGIGMGLAGVGQVVGGISDLFGAGDMIKLGEKQEGIWGGRLSEAEAELRRIRESQPSLSTPSQYFELAKKAFDDRVLQMQRESIGRAFATTTEAAQRYGSRGLGAVIQAQGQAMDQEAQAIAAMQNRELEALRTLGAARQVEQQMKEQRSSRDLSYAYDERAAAEAGLWQAEQIKQQGREMRRGAVGNIVGGAIGTVAGLYTGGLFGGATAKTGMKVRKTPGKFSHEENPLHVIDNDSKKVAELTGGEYILNPEQASKLKELSTANPEALRKYVRKLVKKFEK